MEIIILILIGILGGFLAGMLGVGGGIIFIPVLTYFFEKEGFTPDAVVKATLANSLFLVFGSGVSGTLRQLQEKALRWKNTLIIGLPGGAVSYALTQLIAMGTWYSKELFQMVFLVFLILSIIKMFLPQRQSGEVLLTDSLPLNRSILVGVLAGAVVAVSGLGGGIVMVPMFQWLFKLDIKQASRLSLSVIPLLSVFPIINYLFQTTDQSMVQLGHTCYVVWEILLPTLLGVLIFAPIGIKTASKVSSRVLSIIFATLSIIIFLKTLYAIFN